MTSNEIIKKIKVGKTNKITLIKTRATIDLWWEDSEKWFCNVLRLKDQASTWVIAKDLDLHISTMLKNGYKIKE